MKWTEYNEDVDDQMFAAHQYLIYNKKKRWCQVVYINPINRQMTDVITQHPINKSDIALIMSYDEILDEAEKKLGLK